MFDVLSRQFPEFQERFLYYAGKCKRLEAPAKTVLLREGDISRKSFFVEQGCLRVWFSHQGREVTFQFCFEDQGISSIESFAKRIPSMFAIETVESSVVWVFGKSDFDALMEELADDNRVLREAVRVLFERQLHYMREFLSFIRDTPKQRYLHLLRDKPYIVQRVPQHYIASYLGITPVHLSRIRNQLAKEGVSGRY